VIAKSPRTWREPSWKRWFPPILISAVGIFLCCSIWGKTGEILLDFGNDQYAAWQVSQGKLLFRDIACIYGPLSPNINALVMRVAGPQLNAILGANLIILILTTGLLYWLLRVISGTLTALTATIFFLCVFALNSPTKITNYNFLTPYAHQITHGFALTMGAVACLHRFQRRRSTSAAVLGGILTGAAFLTKPEIFLGCATTYFLGLLAVLCITPGKRIARVLICATVGMLVPPLGFLLFYALQMPFHAALSGVLGGWQFVGKPFVVSTPFYKGDLGTDQPLRNLILMFQYAGFYVVSAAVLASIAILGNKLLKQNRWATAAVGVLLGSASFFLVTEAGKQFDSFWPDAARGFPLFAAFAIVVSARRMAKARADGQGQSEAIVQWTLSILSLILLAKIFLAVRMYHYGFVLCAPCAMLIIVAFIHWLPAWTGRMCGSVAIVRLGALGLLAAFVSENLVLTRENLRERTMAIPLALGGIAWSRPFDSASVDAIKWLSTTSATAAVIPDAAGINYAAGRPSSVPFTELNPMTLAMFGEKNVVRAFDRNPPDYILIMEAQETAFGARTFGRDYGLQLSSWIVSNYRHAGRFPTGSHPIELWEFDPALGARSSAAMRPPSD
jgi:hypothetical protein